MIGIISIRIVVKIYILCQIRLYGEDRHVRIITSHHCTTLIRPQVMKPLGVVCHCQMSRETQDTWRAEMTIRLMKCHFFFASGLLYLSEFMDVARERPKDNAPSAKWKTIRVHKHSKRTRHERRWIKNSLFIGTSSTSCNCVVVRNSVPQNTLCCHICLHWWWGEKSSSPKGVFYIAVIWFILEGCNALCSSTRQIETTCMD